MTIEIEKVGDEYSVVFGGTRTFRLGTVEEVAERVSEVILQDLEQKEIPF